MSLGISGTQHSGTAAVIALLTGIFLRLDLMLVMLPRIELRQVEQLGVELLWLRLL